MRFLYSLFMDFYKKEKDRQRAEYWNFVWPIAVIKYKAQGNYYRDIRTLICDRSHILQEAITKNRLDEGTDDVKIINILKFVYNTIKYVPDVATSGVEEFWQHPEITLQKKKGDCEDFSLLIKSLALMVGIPDYKIKVCAGWVLSNSKLAGHCYCIYVRDDDTWCVIDGTFYVNFTNVNNRLEHKEEKLYYPVEHPIWWTVNRDYSYSQNDVLLSGRVKEVKENG